MLNAEKPSSEAEQREAKMKIATYGFATDQGRKLSRILQLSKTTSYHLVEFNPEQLPDLLLVFGEEQLTSNAITGLPNHYHSRMILVGKRRPKTQDYPFIGYPLVSSRVLSALDKITCANEEQVVEPTEAEVTPEVPLETPMSEASTADDSESLTPLDPLSSTDSLIPNELADATLNVAVSHEGSVNETALNEESVNEELGNEELGNEELVIAHVENEIVKNEIVESESFDTEGVEAENLDTDINPPENLQSLDTFNEAIDDEVLTNLIASDQAPNEAVVDGYVEPAETEPLESLDTTLDIPLDTTAEQTATTLTNSVENDVVAATDADDTLLEPETESAAAKYRVLVVDDSHPMQQALAKELQTAFEQLHIDFADEGLTALDLAEQNSYDFIFLDIMMPGIDGFETCTRMRAMEKLKKLPIIMLSSKTSPLDEVKGIMAGSSTYLTKPIDPEEFQKVIARIRKWLDNFS